jgi:hypothetical protein
VTVWVLGTALLVHVTTGLLRSLVLLNGEHFSLQKPMETSRSQHGDAGEAGFLSKRQTGRQIFFAAQLSIKLGNISMRPICGVNAHSLSFSILTVATTYVIGIPVCA